MHSSSAINPSRISIRWIGSIRSIVALLLAATTLLAGCHRNTVYSNYGIAWVTLTSTPDDIFASYIVNVDSVTLLRSDGISVPALGTPETVDFTKLDNIAELWGSATIPTGTYTTASVVLDYTSAVISIIVNGKPVKVAYQDATGAAVTTVTVTINLEPAANAPYQLTIAPTYATTSAQRLALDFNLPASTVSVYNPTGATPTLVVRPYMTAAIAPADNKPIRIRGPLINSNVGLGTYTVYERPFHDAVDNLGTLSLFTTADTIYTTNGVVAQGTPGLTQLSQSSAGTTVTAAYTTYQPTAAPTATAGKFTALYVVAGSTLEDVYTSGIEGDVVARSGNTLTLQASTLTLNDGISTYNVANAELLVGPNTLVTADRTLLTGLNYTDVAVGQHVVARGIYSLSGTTVVVDATGNSATNTGSVRLLPTRLWGSLVAAGAGGLTLNLQAINAWPVADYAFSGNGTSAATDPVPATFAVNTGSLAVPATAAGDPLWVNGRFAPFGSAPPAFFATSVNDEASVQTAGTTPTSPTPLSCGQANFDCVPATLEVVWSARTTAPFSALTVTGLTVDLGSANLSSAVIRIGPEAINMQSLAASPPIIPTALPALVSTNTNTPGSIPVTLPPVFLPEYSYGNPLAAAPAGINVSGSFGTFATGLAAVLSTGVLQFEATGTYNRAANTFTAASVDVVL